jgi:hypothetical protein
MGAAAAHRSARHAASKLNPAVLMLCATGVGFNLSRYDFRDRR